jgi:hypothetical protein
VDAAGEIAHLAERCAGAIVGVVHQPAGLSDLGGVVLLLCLDELLLCQSQLHSKPDQLGLRAVVEVAFDPAQARRCLVDRTGP